MKLFCMYSKGYLGGSCSLDKHGFGPLPWADNCMMRKVNFSMTGWIMLIQGGKFICQITETVFIRGGTVQYALIYWHDLQHHSSNKLKQHSQRWIKHSCVSEYCTRQAVAKNKELIQYKNMLQHFSVVFLHQFSNKYDFILYG